MLFLIAALVVAFPVTAAAAAPPSFDPDVLAAEPAVEAPPEAEEEEEQPWTQRYLAPTVLLLGVVALGGSLLYYGLRIRGRYRVSS